ncbi:MAG TPA: DUF1569 domain-containing protein [Flavitalea sp.]|nr:DUF1569 domain-containing protein [Flavitalea sp.]
MKTVMDTANRNELINRIQSLQENSKREWGKMNAYQMVKHCVLCEEMYLGKRKYKRAFIGYIFGRIGLKKLLKNDTPLKINEPTSPHFKIDEPDGDFSAEKLKWISLMKEYGSYSNDDFEHWFFGKMTKEQVGLFVYKHTDHHLRQFNC